MAKVALIGASGAVGSRLLKELSDRGHTVTGIARNPEKIAALPGVTARKGDVFDEKGLAEPLRGHDVAISSVHFLDSDADML
ncbi:MAG: NAD-dependent epimerase/dehydratase family protein, partial [Mesorhizobium sp.]